MIIYYASYKLAKEIFDSSSGLQLHDFPACSMYRLVTHLFTLIAIERVRNPCDMSSAGYNFPFTHCSSRYELITIEPREAWFLNGR